MLVDAPSAGSRASHVVHYLSVRGVRMGGIPIHADDACRPWIRQLSTRHMYQWHLKAEGSFTCFIPCLKFVAESRTTSLTRIVGWSSRRTSTSSFWDDSLCTETYFKRGVPAWSHGRLPRSQPIWKIQDPLHGGTDVHPDRFAREIQVNHWGPLLVCRSHWGGSEHSCSELGPWHSTRDPWASNHQNKDH